MLNPTSYLVKLAVKYQSPPNFGEQFSWLFGQLGIAKLSLHGHRDPSVRSHTHIGKASLGASPHIHRPLRKGGVHTTRHSCNLHLLDWPVMNGEARPGAPVGCVLDGGVGGWGPAVCVEPAATVGEASL